MESKLQAEIIKWLKVSGAYVIKPRPGPGVPVGCPDIIFLFQDKWGVIEVKADEKSQFQPGQESTLRSLREWSPHVFVVHPNNWRFTQGELTNTFF
jgi:Holliday junction resolvase